ncbi:MAG: hypothetical protein ABMA02_12925, partial [Saprospiraceae bacterium]
MIKIYRTGVGIGCYIAISLAAGSLLAQCPSLGPIVGPATPQFCTGVTYPYTIPGSGPAALVWSLNVSPPAYAIFSGPSTGETVALDIGGSGPFQLCATPTNPCYDPTPVCMDIEIQPTPDVDEFPNLHVCDGEQVDIHFTGTGWTYHWNQQNHPLYSLSAFRHSPAWAIFPSSPPTRGTLLYSGSWTCSRIREVVWEMALSGLSSSTPSPPC